MSGKTIDINIDPNQKINLVRIAVIAGVILILFFMRPFTIVNAGHAGLVFNFGAVSDRILEPGLHFKIPVMQNILQVDVRIQKSETPASSASKDLQTVSTTVALNYHLLKTRVNTVYNEVGLGFEDKIIDPAVQEIVKGITARYTAEELITKREVVSLQIRENLETRLKKYNLIVDDFSIKSFNFSAEFDKAIEAKQTAEQEALKAEREVRRVEAEAQQKVARARAEAEELRLKSRQITPMMVQMEWIKKWDGKLPTYMTGENQAVLMQMGK